MAATDPRSKKVRGMTRQRHDQSLTPRPYPALLVYGAHVHIPREAMMGAAVRALNVVVVSYLPTRDPDLGRLHCKELDSGYDHPALWVHPSRIIALPLAQVRVRVRYPEAS